MTDDQNPGGPANPVNAGFQTTHWSVVLAAGSLVSPNAQSALGELCRTYWYPLYCCVRRHGRAPADAQDLTQAFFTKLLLKNQIALADPERGRFRTFLLRSLENFLRSQHRAAGAQKRGGGVEWISWDAEVAETRYSSEPSEGLSPAALFERQWAGTTLETVLAALRLEFAEGGRPELFEALEPHLWGDETSTPHADIASELGMTVVAVRVTLHRLRRRFQEVFRAHILNTVEDEADIEDEIRHLRRALAGGDV